MKITQFGSAAGWRTALVLAAGLVLAVGCTKVEQKDNKAGPGKGGATGAPAAGGPAAADACKKYGDALCKEVGPRSPTCQSLKSTLALLPPAACAAGMTDVAYTKSKLSGQRQQCDELASKLCADLGPTTKTCKMVQAQTPRFPPDRCAMMMAKYPQVLAELKGMEEANKPLTAEKLALINAETPSSFGPKDAKVTVVEFSDFECPYCSKAAAVMKQIKEKYGTKVRLVFRHYPLPFHKNAPLAHQASMEAAVQGKFWEFHDLLFANQKGLDRATLEKHATTLKLDLAKFKKALDDKTHEKAMTADVEIGKKVGVRGTPTLIVNGERVQNSLDFASVSKLIDKVLAK